jgi:cytochrome P450
MKNSQTALSITTQLLRDPLHLFPCYRELREHSPVYFSAEFRSWFVTRYHDVQRVIADPLLFSSEQSIRRRAKPIQTR